MNADREKNGPTQVHPPPLYNDLTSHIQLNGIGGVMLGKPSFGECWFSDLDLLYFKHMLVRRKMKYLQKNVLKRKISTLNIDINVV